MLPSLAPYQLLFDRLWPFHVPRPWPLYPPPLAMDMYRVVDSDDLWLIYQMCASEIWGLW